MIRTVQKLGRTFYVEDLKGDIDFWDVYQRGWEDDTHLFIDRVLECCSMNGEPYPTFIDIGAWVGPISLWVADRCGVIALEPDPFAYTHLKKNLDHNKITNVQTTKEAFGDGSEIILGVKETGEFGDSMTSSVYGNCSRTVTASTITLSQIVERYNLDPNNLFIKIDIEGGEAEALLSNISFLKFYRPIMHISFHAPLFDNPEEYLNKIQFFLNELNDSRPAPIDFDSYGFS